MKFFTFGKAQIGPTPKPDRRRNIRILEESDNIFEFDLPDEEAKLFYLPSNNKGLRKKIDEENKGKGTVQKVKEFVQKPKDIKKTAEVFKEVQKASKVVRNAALIASPFFGI